MRRESPSGTSQMSVTRDQFNFYGGALAIVLAVISIGLAACKGSMSKKTADTVGKIVVALWAIFPPAFFWIDWVYFCDLSTSDARDIAKHTHDLARNIWLGVLGVTTLAFFKISP
jgi:hypothetical protein